MGLFKTKEQKEQIGAARGAYEDFVRSSTSAGPEELRELAIKLRESPARAALSERERRKRDADAFRAFAENVLADDYFTIDEELAFNEVADALGVTQEEFTTTFRDLLLRLAIASANDQRLSVLDQPQIIAKKNETVHLETAAALMKEVVQREWRSGSSGVSFRIAPGVRYRVGQTRGHSVVVGTELQVEDTGVLSVTSQRVAFMGMRKTLEVPYAKLLNIDVFTDGVRLHASNRQKAPLFKFGERLMGDVVAATVNAAIQRFNA
jgi:hypothetical protein